MIDKEKIILKEKRFSISEIAAMLSVAPITIRRKIADKSLGFYQLGGKGKIFIAESQLMEFLKKSEHTAR